MFVPTGGIDRTGISSTGPVMAFVSTVMGWSARSPSSGILKLLEAGIVTYTKVPPAI